MFIRVKTTPNSPRKSIQLVESIRDGNKVKQKIIRHVGIAMDDKELVMLKDIAEFIKAKIEDEREPAVFAPETLAQMAIDSRKKNEEVPDSVKLKEVEAVQEVVTGIHDIYGDVYEQIGFDQVIEDKHKSAKDKLFHIVMGRIADPASKKATVRKLESDFGISFSLDSVYRMMDLIDERAVERINALARESAEQLLKEKINLVFYDCTTLYFESFTSDELKDNGYSKDLKFSEVQVLLALMATTEGLPLGYEVYSGNTFEGNTLKDMIEKLSRNYEINHVTFVADSAMFSKVNLEYLEEKGIKYIVSCRIRNQPSKVVSLLQDKSSYIEHESGLKYKELALKDKRVISVYSLIRAKKDSSDRKKSIERLRKKLARSKKTESLISSFGNKKYLKITGSSNIELDEEKIAAAAKFDGIYAVTTNDMNITPAQIVHQYHNLWQIEECFRISKHDLKIRPVFHWTSNRIRAHVAICFMALACVRHLCHRVKLQCGAMSPQRIKDALLTSKLTIVRNKPDSRYYAIPSNASPEAVKIYRFFGKEYSRTPFAVSDLQ
jgi:transposase